MGLLVHLNWSVRFLPSKHNPRFDPWELTFDRLMFLPEGTKGLRIRVSSTPTVFAQGYAKTPIKQSRACVLIAIPLYNVGFKPNLKVLNHACTI